jgi:peptidoglycan/xylan/chitin deacetylase (PgdA/CDA1 family)
MQNKRLDGNPGWLKFLTAGKQYFFKMPWWLQAIFPNRIWHMPRKEKTIYLTFDDGPHPRITNFVLNELKRYNAKATFFCIGKNVQQYPGVYRSILDQGHSVGNHSFDHLNGYATKDEDYIENVNKASLFIRSNLFRPPYGRLRGSQSRKLKNYKIIMWDVLSGDFDESLNKEACLAKLLKNVRRGTLVVFHDSEKAWERMEYALPELLSHFSKRGFKFDKV